MIAFAASVTTYVMLLLEITAFSPAISIKLPKLLFATKVILSKVTSSPAMINAISFNTASSPVMIIGLSRVM